MKGDFGITVSLFVFVLVTAGSALTALLISQYSAFNAIQLFIQEVNAIKHKTSTVSHAPPSPNEDNKIPSNIVPICIIQFTIIRIRSAISLGTGFDSI